MKKLYVILVILFLNSFSGYSQLLSNPFLKVEDIELALSNPKHLRDILLDHKFIFEPGQTGKLNQPASIRNPLVIDAEANKSEYWKIGLNSKKASENGSEIIRSVSLYEWKSGHGPHPNAIKTVTLWVNADPVYAEKVEPFFQRIKDRYPIKNQRYIGNGELQREYSEPINVFANSSSNIEVRMIRGQVGSSKDDVSDFYILSFDLVR